MEQIDVQLQSHLQLLIAPDLRFLILKYLIFIRDINIYRNI